MKYNTLILLVSFLTFSACNSSTNDCADFYENYNKCKDSNKTGFKSLGSENKFLQTCKTLKDDKDIKNLIKNSDNNCDVLEFKIKKYNNSFTAMRKLVFDDESSNLKSSKENTAKKPKIKNTEISFRKYFFLERSGSVNYNIYNSQDVVTRQETVKYKKTNNNIKVVSKSKEVDKSFGKPVTIKYVISPDSDRILKTYHQSAFIEKFDKELLVSGKIKPGHEFKNAGFDKMKYSKFLPSFETNKQKFKDCIQLSHYFEYKSDKVSIKEIYCKNIGLVERKMHKNNKLESAKKITGYTLKKKHFTAKYLKKYNIDPATIDLPKEFKNCDKTQIENNISTYLKHKTLARRIVAYTFLIDYLNIANVQDIIDDLYDESSAKKQKLLYKSAINYERAKNYYLANKQFIKLLKIDENSPKYIARFAIFIANSKGKVYDDEKALLLAQRAQNLSSSTQNIRFAADAFSEIEFNKNGADSACNLITRMADPSHARSRCSEFKHRYNRYRIKILKTKVPESVRYAWRKDEIPEGELECNEILGALDIKATKQMEEKNYEEALQISQKLLGHNMSKEYFVEYLSNYAEHLYNAGKKEKSLQAFDYAIKLANDFCYPYSLKASILFKIDKKKYKKKIIELSDKSLSLCHRKNSRCLYQSALNFYRLKDRSKAIKLIKYGKKLFPKLREFKRAYKKMKKWRKL